MAANEKLFGFNTTQKNSLMDYIEENAGSGTTVTAAGITDSTATGRSLITATDAAAARTTIGSNSAANLTAGTVAPARLPNATTSARGVVLQAAARADSTATDVAGVNTVLNDLLAKLRTAGILA
ncbi:hypothetical protein [Xanthomonas phage DES1]|nr:hypothetical protein [Xanthomonas phage DES1]